MSQIKELPAFRLISESVRDPESKPVRKIIGEVLLSAVAENGPVLIEGNSDYNMAGNDLAYGGYRSRPIFREALKEIGFL